MPPRIDDTRFGSISIDGRQYHADVVVRADGRVQLRREALHGKRFGTSHVLSVGEARVLFAPGVERVIVGSGQAGMLSVSDEALRYFRVRGCTVEVLPKPQGIDSWNAASGGVSGLFHVTC